MFAFLAAHWILISMAWIAADIGFVIVWARWRAPVRREVTWDDRFYGES